MKRITVNRRALAFLSKGMKFGQLGTRPDVQVVLHPKRQPGASQIWYGSKNPVIMYVDETTPENVGDIFDNVVVSSPRLSVHKWDGSEYAKYSVAYRRMIVAEKRLKGVHYVLMRGLESVHLPLVYPVHLYVGVSGAGKTHFTVGNKGIDGDWWGRHTPEGWSLQKAKLTKWFKSVSTRGQMVIAPGDRLPREFTLPLKLGAVWHWTAELIELINARPNFYVQSVVIVQPSDSLHRQTSLLKLAHKLKSAVDAPHNPPHLKREMEQRQPFILSATERKSARRRAERHIINAVAESTAVASVFLLENDAKLSREDAGWYVFKNSPTNSNDTLSLGEVLANLTSNRRDGDTSSPVLSPKSAQNLSWLLGARAQGTAYIHDATDSVGNVISFRDQVGLWKTLKDYVPRDLKTIALEYVARLRGSGTELIPWVEFDHEGTYTRVLPMTHEIFAQMEAIEEAVSSPKTEELAPSESSSDTRTERGVTVCFFPRDLESDLEWFGKYEMVDEMFHDLQRPKGKVRYGEVDEMSQSLHTSFGDLTHPQEVLRCLTWCAIDDMEIVTNIEVHSADHKPIVTPQQYEAWAISMTNPYYRDPASYDSTLLQLLPRVGIHYLPMIFRSLPYSTPQEPATPDDYQDVYGRNIISVTATELRLCLEKYGACMVSLLCLNRLRVHTRVIIKNKTAMELIEKFRE